MKSAAMPSVAGLLRPGPITPTASGHSHARQSLSCISGDSPEVGLYPHYEGVEGYLKSGICNTWISFPSLLFDISISGSGCRSLLERGVW
jgi:hypothetical protein